MAVATRHFVWLKNALQRGMCLVFSIPIFAVQDILAQDLEQIARRDVFSAGGGISLAQVYYRTNAITPSRKPYTYLLSGNLNLKLLGFVDAPFLFFYSNLGNGFTQPTFNQTSLHPKYKWVQTHFGTISCSWSPYTLNGHVFNGGALEISPGNWQLTMAYGRFLKRTTPAGNTGSQIMQSSWKRIGGGAGFQWSRQDKGRLGASVFGAKDVLDLDSWSSTLSPPKGNLAIAINGSLRLFKKWTVQGELANSVLTEDTRVNSAFYDHKRHAMFPIQNATTKSYQAVKLRTDFSINKHIVHFGYERIDPGYRTLGAYYFNNDLENVTLGANASLLKGRLVLQGNVGKQRDNLDGNKLGFMQRTLGNFSLQLMASKKWSFQCNYSNFLSHTNLRSFSEYNNTSNPYQNWDTLNFRQVSQNAGISVQGNLRKDSVISRFANLNIIAQTAAERQNGELKNGSLFLNAVASIGQVKLRSGTGVVFSLSAAKADIGGVGVFSLSPGFIIGTSFFNKQVKTNFSAAFTNNFSSGKSAGGILNLRNQWSCTLAKLHQLSLNVLVLRKQINAQAATPNLAFRESTISFSYSVNTTFFDLKKVK